MRDFRDCTQAKNLFTETDIVCLMNNNLRLNVRTCISVVMETVRRAVAVKHAVGKIKIWRVSWSSLDLNLALVFAQPIDSTILEKMCRRNLFK